MSQQLAVQPKELDDQARVLQAVAGELGAHAASLAELAASARSAVGPGAPRLASAVAECARAWSTQLDRLARTHRENASRLRRSADAYRRHESDVVSLLSALRRRASATDLGRAAPGSAGVPGQVPGPAQPGPAAHPPSVPTGPPAPAH